MDWSIVLSCELCTVCVEPRRRIIIAYFEHLIAVIGGLEAVLNDNQAKIGTELKTIQEKMEPMTEATDLEPDPEELKSVAVHEEVPKEEAALMKRYGDLQLAVGHR
jgi:hypothetical protein